MMFLRTTNNSFKKQQNIRNHIIRAKFFGPIKSFPQRYLKGIKKCGTNCSACPYIKEGRDIQINNKKLKNNRQINCHSYNVAYALIC